MAATEADVELVRRAFEEFDPSRPEGLEEYFDRFWHPDAVIEAADRFPVPGSYRGLDGYRQWYEDSYGPYRDVDRRLHSLTPRGDCVVMLLTITGHSISDDVELELHIGTTYEVEDDRIRRMRIYLSHERALEAAAAP